jgi:transposase
MRIGCEAYLPLPTLWPVCCIDRMDSSLAAAVRLAEQEASELWEEHMRKDTRIGVDLAKSVFEIAVSHEPGKVAHRERLPRGRLLEFFAQQPKACVVMEACGSAHHWGREVEKLGHTPILLPPGHVNPYVLRDKFDRADAKGVLEAERNEEILPVPVKTIPQQTMASLHRFRSGWMRERTARINSVRGVLREFGIVIPTGSKRLVPNVRALVDDADAELPVPLRHVLVAACEEIRYLEARIHDVEIQLRAFARQLPEAKRLMTIPGIGLLTATALIAFVGDVRRFKKARRFASYLGLTPRESSSGYKRRLGRISKRGDAYLRTLLIHGARAVLAAAARSPKPDRLRTWGLERKAKANFNKGAVALANKIARIVWAVWRKDDAVYRSQPAQDAE